MDYKKIFTSQQLRFSILRMLRWVPDSIMLRIQYRIKMGFWPSFKSSKRYTEKIQLYKMYYRNPIMHQCVDKYEVRNYVANKGLEHILNELYGVYDRFEDIDFSVLPKQFVIKTTNGGGGQNVIVVTDKNTLDYEDLHRKLSLWVDDKNYGALAGREWAYQALKPRIIVEKYLEDSHGVGLSDYKLMFFNGKFRLLWVDKDRYVDHHRGFWDEDLHFLPNVYSDHATFQNPPALPSNIQEMIRIGQSLAGDFPYARIDLYNVDNKVVFGEITFYPWSGYVKFTPDEFDFRLGSYFEKL